MLFIWIRDFGYSTQFSRGFEILANYKIKIEKMTALRNENVRKNGESSGSSGRIKIAL